MLIFQRSSCSFVIGGRRSENPDANPSTEESRRSPREASAHPSSTGPRVFGRMSTKSPDFQKWPFRILKILLKEMAKHWHDLPTLPNVAIGNSSKDFSGSLGSLRSLGSLGVLGFSYRFYDYYFEIFSFLKRNLRLLWRFWGFFNHFQDLFFFVKFSAS